MATVEPVVALVVCQTPYYVLQWVAIAKERDFAANHQQQGAPVGPHVINQLYVLVIANMFAQILVFVSSCCNPIIYALTSPQTFLGLLTKPLISKKMYYVLPDFAIIYGLLNENFRTS